MRSAGRKKGEYRQATRLLRLVDLLRARYWGATHEEIAEEFHVTERQVRRDLAALEEAGFAIEPSPTPDGRARARLAGGKPHSLLLTLRERYGLLAVRRVFDVLDGTPLQDDVRSIYAKVAASLPDADRAELEAFGERFLYVPDGGLKGYTGKEEVLDGLLTAVIHRLRVRYRYRPASGKPHAGLLEPYAMVLYKNGLYVIGRAVPDGHEPAGRKPYVFAAERFERAEHVRGDRFPAPEGFRVDEFFHGAFGLFLGGETERVVIEFTPAVRHLVEARTWHRTQRLKRLPGGGVSLAFDVANLKPVVWWVLEWGAAARVRQPPSLVEEVTRALRDAAAQYGGAVQAARGGPAG